MYRELCGPFWPSIFHHMAWNNWFPNLFVPHRKYFCAFVQFLCNLFAAFGLSSFHWHRLLKWQLRNGLRINRGPSISSPAILILEKSNLPQRAQSRDNMRTNRSKVHDVPFLLTRIDSVEHYSWWLISSTANLTEASHLAEKTFPS